MYETSRFEVVAIKLWLAQVMKLQCQVLAPLRRLCSGPRSVAAATACLLHCAAASASLSASWMVEVVVELCVWVSADLLVWVSRPVCFCSVGPRTFSIGLCTCKFDHWLFAQSFIPAAPRRRRHQAVG